MPWRSLVLENRWQKLFALGLAILIWFTVGSTERLRLVDDASNGAHTIFQVPIVVLTTAADLGRYEVSPSVVHVELRGAPDRLRNMNVELIEAYVNLVDLGITPQRVPIHINPPAGTTVKLMVPATVLVDRLSENSSPPPSP